MLKITYYTFAKFSEYPIYYNSYSYIIKRV